MARRLVDRVENAGTHVGEVTRTRLVRDQQLDRVLAIAAVGERAACDLCTGAIGEEPDHLVPGANAIRITVTARRRAILMTKHP